MKTSLGAHRTVRKGNFNFGTFRSIYLIYQALYRTSKHSKPHEDSPHSPAKKLNNECED